MAIHLMDISGKIANVVFYTRNGKNLARIAPSRVKRTPNMKARNRNFGIASSNTGRLRRMLAGLLPFPKDKSMQSRFSGAMARWLGKRDLKDIPPGQDLVYLSDFQFNDKCRLGQRLRVPLTVNHVSDNMLQVDIPAFVPTDSIIAPAGTLSVLIELGAGVVDLDKQTSFVNYSTHITIPYTADSIAAQTIDLPVATKSGHLVLTACALKYMMKESAGEVVCRNPVYMPCGVVDARYC